MIIGQLSDVARQQALLPAAVVRGIEALSRLDLLGMAPGRYELDGDKLFYLIQDAVPRTLDEGRPEAHQLYADVQIPVSASERYGFSLPQADLVATDDHLEDRDLAFYPSPRNEFFMDIAPGAYAVFLPNELHRPCIVIESKSAFRKAVIKVHASLLGL